MNLNSNSTAAKLRHLGGRHLRPDAYLRALTKLADIDIGASVADGYLAEIDRVAELRGRIAILERKIEYLEAHK
ncbi:hypothetical protein ACSBOB_15430 [Mesorhizobium sp. ASY16-5R]|uniref:hypothetical protein n=1 Tax=Mesorhizobium sp. ASY16-5R TaxID=3445772 RepID=UPI003F9FDB2B